MIERRMLFDPTADRRPARRQPRPRPASLEGLTIGLLDISKGRGHLFMRRLGELIAARGLQVKRYRKRTFAQVAPVALKQRISQECDVVIEGLAD